jgi:hypothetical protein
VLLLIFGGVAVIFRNRVAPSLSTYGAGRRVCGGERLQLGDVRALRSKLKFGDEWGNDYVV